MTGLMQAAGLQAQFFRVTAAWVLEEVPPGPKGRSTMVRHGGFPLRSTDTAPGGCLDLMCLRTEGHPACYCFFFAAAHLFFCASEMCLRPSALMTCFLWPVGALVNGPGNPPPPLLPRRFWMSAIAA